MLRDNGGVQASTSIIHTIGSQSACCGMQCVSLHYSKKQHVLNNLHSQRTSVCILYTVCTHILYIFTVHIHNNNHSNDQSSLNSPNLIKGKWCKRCIYFCALVKEDKRRCLQIKMFSNKAYFPMTRYIQILTQNLHIKYAQGKHQVWQSLNSGK